MRMYERLDAWQLTHALVLAVWRCTDSILATEPELSHRLRYVTLRAGGRIAFASAMSDRQLAHTALCQAGGYVGEAEELLGLLSLMGLLPEAAMHELTDLRERAAAAIEALWLERLDLPDIPDCLVDEDWDEPEAWQK